MSALSATILIANQGSWHEALRQWQSQLSGNEVLLLHGELGAGKTTFVRALVELRLGANVMTASPSFALHHRYDGRGQVFDHWDLYRIKSIDELENVGFWEILEDQTGLVAVEWPQLVPKKFWSKSRPIVNLHISVRSPGDRIVEISV